MMMHGLINPKNDNLSKSSAGVKTKQRFVSFQPYYSTEIILYIPTQYAIMN
jgi:hypothetical protein